MNPKILTRFFIILAILFAPVAAIVFPQESIASEAQVSKTKKGTNNNKKSNSKSSKKGNSNKNNSKSYNKNNKQNSRNSRFTKSKTKPKNTRSWAAKPTPIAEKPQNDSLTMSINEAVLAWIPQKLNPGGLRINSVKPNHSLKSANIGLNENFTYLPVTQELISGLQRTIRDAMPDSLHNYRIDLNVGNRSLAYYIATIDKLPEKYRKNTPFVRAKTPDFTAPKGMDGDIVALWASHGRYFKNGGWYWQRPLLFQTLEDIYTLGYMYPYVVPMIENAGGYVMMPRERDPNPIEVIVDNDINSEGEVYSQPYYKEIAASTKWETGEEDGFIYDLKEFRDTENPFEVGTYRQTRTINKGKPSMAAWYADIPEDGNYAVYVSYKTLPESTTDALYTVNYSGGSKEFLVNQTMGGSTWIYLGTFPLDKGYSDNVPVVTLSNMSSKSGNIVTADAVKIGGGMGNIARSNRRSDIYYDSLTPNQVDVEIDENSNEEQSDSEEDQDNESVDPEDTNIQSAPQTKNSGHAPVFSTSRLPRYLEGARYWLHWAGFPEEVYSPYHGKDDYKDDYTSRGIWVNYLAGGSRILPDNDGLGIPVDVAMALHSDAGKRADDSIIGTLGIYYTHGGDKYDDGTPRINSRILTDMVMRQITGDIRQTFEPNWTRRSMWDKSYLEARVPEVPTTLIELMSHQNYGDMQYGLDPSFRFLVGRSIYKALARFVAERKGRQVVIQPLPVKDFYIKRTGKGKFRLSWKPMEDKLEPTAKPNKYIIYERSSGVRSFTKIGETKSTKFDIIVRDNQIHSFRIVASNEGGVSFPSEILALRESPNGKTPILIVNGFTRVAAPAHWSANGNAGFDTNVDAGVPYGVDLSFSGAQYEFRRNAGDKFGASSGNKIGTPIAGNTFDFTVIHGEAIAAAGEGFVSSSVGAIESGAENLRDYKIVDFILGRQKATVTGKGNTGVRFRAFPEKLQSHLREYLRKGGHLIISGEYVASDLTGEYATDQDREFASRILKIETEPEEEISRAIVEPTSAMASKFGMSFAPYNNEFNSDYYIVQHPDRLISTDSSQSEPLLTFGDSQQNAALGIRDGKSRRIVMSVPFESITDKNKRDMLMNQFLDYLTN